MNARHELSASDIEAVRAIAGRCLGRLSGIERVPSHQNIVCRLRLADGRRRVLKLARAGNPHPGLTREPAVYELLRHHGLPVPVIDCADLTGELVGRPWFVATDAGRRTAADPSGLSHLNRLALFRTAGRLLAKVHTIAFDRPADFHGPDLVAPDFDLSPLQSWHRRQLRQAQGLGVLKLAASASGETDALSPQPESPAVQALMSLPKPSGFALCHGDFNTSQCVRRGPKVTALVDWEAAHVGDPAYDLAAFEVMLQVSAPRDLADVARAGYRDVRPVSPEQEAAYLPVQLAHAASLAVFFHQRRRSGPFRAARSLAQQLASPAAQAA